MAGAFALFGFLLALCGIAIGVSGVVSAVHGGPVVGPIFVFFALVVFYGAYLFGRTARKARRAASSDDAARIRQGRQLRFFSGYIVIGIAGLVGLPVPGTVKVIAAVTIIGGTVVAMAARTDPPRRG